MELPQLVSSGQSRLSAGLLSINKSLFLKEILF